MKAYITELKRIGCAFYFLCSPVLSFGGSEGYPGLNSDQQKKSLFVNMIQQKLCEKAVTSCQSFYYQ